MPKRKWWLFSGGVYDPSDAPANERVRYARPMESTGAPAAVLAVVAGGHPQNFFDGRNLVADQRHTFVE